MTDSFGTDASGLSVRARCAFLARVAHEQTVHARDAYVVGTDEADGRRLRESNEFVHRLTGHMMRVAANQDDWSWEAAMGIIAYRFSHYRGAMDKLRAWLREAATKYPD